VVAVCQNGVEHAQRLEAQVPREAVVPVVVHASAVRVGPGRVRCDGPLRLIVPACAHAALIVEAFEGDGVSVRVVEDFQTAQWRKLCLNAVAGIMAATGRPAVVFRETMFRTMAQDLAMECVQVARAEGARIGNEYAQEVVDYFVSLAPDAGSSILADRMAHRPLEWDARNGVIQRLGSRHGIPTPVSDLLVPLLAQASVVSTSSPAY
jgi:2-dehydropantoate 2-reductase